MNAPEKVLPAKSPFETLYAVDVSRHIEKKNGLSYLSWAWAVAELMKADPSANWQIHEPTTYPDGTMMVSCTVTAFNKPVFMWLPVMDNRNKAIQNPDAFAINKNQMRCLVKAISCHGLGLYIYAGEDLPEAEKEATSAADDALLAQYREAAMKGTTALKAFHKAAHGDSKVRVWQTHGEALKQAADKADMVTA